MARTPRFDRYMVVNGAGRGVLLKRRFTVPERYCWFLGVLSIASASPIRGWLFLNERVPASIEDIAEEAGVPVKTAEKCVRKARELGWISFDDVVACDRVVDFDVHNPAPKSDKTNAERQARYRERQRQAALEAESRDGVTPRNARVTPVTPAPVTARNGREVEEEVEEEVEVERRREETARALTADRPAVAHLCALLADLVAANGSKRPTVTDEWKRECIALLDEDGCAPTECERLIRWALANDFWRGVIDSLPRFRKHYEKIRLQADRKPSKAEGNAAVLRMLEGGAA